MRINLQFILFFLVFLIFSSIQSVQASQNRIALVIGNSDYKDAPLKNPRNDAIDMASKLIKLGFKVEKLINADNRQMKRAIQRFGKNLRDKNTVGLFYFAGHGIQVDGTNFLLPIKANIESEADVEFEAVNAARILHQMERAENNLNLVILDACRNNPFARSFRSVSRGLAKMEAPNGSMILYATSPGNVAADGERSNGLFTEKLLKMMDKKGLKIEEVFKQTAIEVSKASDNKQYPYIEGFILGDFYFNAPVTINKVQMPAKVTSSDPDIVNRVEHNVWESVESSPSQEMYEYYLSRYPNGHYAGLAKLKIKQLEKAKAYKSEPTVMKGKLTIRSNVYGDTVFLNGEYKGSTRLELTLKPGVYVVKVKKTDYEAWEEQIDVKSGSEHNVYAKLNKLSMPEIINSVQKETTKDVISPSNQTMNDHNSPNRSWRMVSTFPKNYPSLGIQANNQKKRIEKWTKNNIKLYGAGELLPALGVFKAVKNGTVETGWAFSQYWIREDYGFDFLTSYPDLPFEKFIEWSLTEQAQKFREKLYHRNNIHAVACGANHQEGDFWVHKPINNITDLHNLKIRVSGRYQMVLKKIGIATQKLPGGDVLTTLKSKRLDGAHWSSPDLDYALGLHKFTNYYYYPSSLERGQVLDLMINLDTWNSITLQERKKIEELCKKNLLEGWKNSKNKGIVALKKIKNKGIIIEELPYKVRLPMSNAWKQIKNKFTSKSIIAKEMAQSLDSY